MKVKYTTALLASLFLAGANLTSILSSGWIENITVRNGITLNINGENVIPTDVSGKQIPVFLYDSTTYVPVRFLSESYGKNVDWDPETATVLITDQKESEQPSWPDEVNPETGFPENAVSLFDFISYSKGFEKFETETTGTGKVVHNGLLGITGHNLNFKLNEKVSKITFKLAHLKDSSYLNFYQLRYECNDDSLRNLGSTLYNLIREYEPSIDLDVSGMNSLMITIKPEVKDLLIYDAIAYLE